MPAFHKTPPLFPTVLFAAREAASSNYFWDNRNREPEGIFVIQRTLSGTASLMRKEKTVPVPPGHAMCFVYGESTAYGIDRKAAAPYLLEYAVLPPHGGIGDLIGQLREEFGDVFSMQENGEAARILSSLVEAFAKGMDWDHLHLAEWAYRLVLAIYREQMSDSPGRDPVAHLRRQLQHQYRNGKNIKEWTQELPQSREHLSRVFRNRYGESPAAYLRRLRLSHAQLLARTQPNMATADIASACGFHNVQSFRRAMRKREDAFT